MSIHDSQTCISTQDKVKEHAPYEDTYGWEGGGLRRVEAVAKLRECRDGYLLSADTSRWNKNRWKEDTLPPFLPSSFPSFLPFFSL